jgi:hypothetical protein
MRLREFTSRRHSVLNMLHVPLLFTSAPSARLLCISDAISLRRGGAYVLLRSTGLECRLSPLEVAPVVLRTDEGEDNDVSGNCSNEDSLNESVVWHILRAIWSLDCCA